MKDRIAAWNTALSPRVSDVAASCDPAAPELPGPAHGVIAASSVPPQLQEEIAEHASEPALASVEVNRCSHAIHASWGA